MLLDSALSRTIRIGRLTVIDAVGRRHLFEGSPGPVSCVRLRDPALHWRLLLRPRLFVPEAFMAGTLTIEEGSLYDFVDVLTANEGVFSRTLPVRLAEVAARGLRRLHQYNPVRRARRNVAHHYDLSDQLYELFLDHDRQYSCAYFAAPSDDIDTAQRNKKRHIAAKLLLRPGQRVLDIGSGWGGLALYLAAECDVEVTGLTLSEEQHKVSTRRAAQAGLADRVRFHLRDYREERGQYERIVSVGMFEHVGVNQYPTFFRQLDRLLTADGAVLLHAIGRMDGPGATNPWLRKYIFPGGYSPALSEVVPHAERARLWITDIEILRLHYAETLRAWRHRFEQNRERVRTLYDERFCRMWEMYLVGAELAFRRGGHLVFQMQMAKAVDTVPLTRDYMIEWERAHALPADDPTGRSAPRAVPPDNRSPLPHRGRGGTARAASGG
jgi:cyclopropane-fatty-acyl-phospholipid synthase